MDEEHEACARALDRLVQLRSVASLRAVLAEFEVHFKHEEQLLDTHLYADTVGAGSAAQGFSADAGARKSHWADHARQLATIRCQLRIAGADEAAEGGVPVALVEQVVSDFERHATQYDGAYADRLAAGMHQQVCSTSPAAITAPQVKRQCRLAPPGCADSLLHAGVQAQAAGC